MDQSIINQALAEVDAGSLSRLARLSDRLQGKSNTSSTGSLRSRQLHGKGHEFYDYGRYNPGDDIRAIDHRASARSTRFLVRRHHDELASDWFICLDRSASMAIGQGHTWLRAMQLSATFAYLLLHAGNRVGMITFSSEIDDLCPAGRGRSQYARILKKLENSRPEARGGASDLSSCLAQLGKNVSPFVISDFLRQDGMRPDLARLRRLGGQLHAVQLVSPEQHLISNHGPVTVEDIESGRSAIVMSDQQSHDAVLTRLTEHSDQLSQFCIANGISYSQCSVNHSWLDSARQHLQRGLHSRA